MENGSTAVTEIVEFEVVPEVSDTEFVGLVDALERDFHSRQSGFIDTELLRGREERRWVMVQHWRSPEEAKAVIGLMMRSPVTEAFRRAVDPRSVTMRLLERVGRW